jgi:hypothetical protein
MQAKQFLDSPSFPDVIHRRFHKTGSSGMNLWLRTFLPCEYGIIALGSDCVSEMNHAQTSLSSFPAGRPVAVVGKNSVTSEDLPGRGRRTLTFDKGIRYI